MKLVFLPPCALELMPTERVWARMSQHDLSNRVFPDTRVIDWASALIWNEPPPKD